MVRKAMKSKEDASVQRAVWRNGGGKCGFKMFCGNPPLRQAAIPLCASGGQRGGTTK